MGLNFSGWLGGGSNSDVYHLRGFNRHRREIRAAAYVIHFHSYSLLSCRQEKGSVWPCFIILLPLLSCCLLILLLLLLLRKQFEAKDAWLRATMALSALICCFLLMSCQDMWTGMGWEEEWGRGEGGGEGVWKKEPWFGNGIWVSEKKLS